MLKMRQWAYEFKRNIYRHIKNWYNFHINGIKNDEICSLTSDNSSCYNLSEKKGDQEAQKMDEKEIKETVTEILNETDLDVAPISVVSIANFYGFNVYEMPMEDSISGIIMADDKDIKGFNTNKIVIVNSNHSARRKRFTIAHELGHYFINNRPTKCFAHRDAGNYSSEERDANNFASVLLMPEDEIRREVNNFRKSKSGELPDFQLINYIADAFDVSQSAAEVRLKKLSMI